MEAILAGLFGLLIGSFLNVCIHRWPRDLSVVRPRSHCPACDKTIAWYDNIPLASYLLLRGRCRHCGARISLRYPAVELATALLFFHFVRTLGPTLPAARMCVFSAICLALVFSDLEQRILPDELTCGGAILGLIFSAFVATPDDTVRMFLWVLDARPGDRGVSVLESMAGAIVPAGALLLGGWLFEKLRHKEGLGLGDVKLIAMVGAFLGLRGALATLLLGSLSGSLLGYGYIKLTKQDASTYELPFGTFLALAALVIGITGPALLP